MSDSFTQRVIRTALVHLGKPYVWGSSGTFMWTPVKPVPTIDFANCTEAYDCAGLVKSAVYDCGGIDTRWTWSAQEMYDRLPVPRSGEPFVLRLYGKTPENISHVAFELGNGLVLEAAGGDHTTTTYVEAMRRNACVRVGFEMRGDLLGRRSFAPMEQRNSTKQET